MKASSKTIAKIGIITTTPLVLCFVGILLAAGWTYASVPSDDVAVDANAGFTFLAYSFFWGLIGLVGGLVLSVVMTIRWFDDPSARLAPVERVKGGV